MFVGRKWKDLKVFLLIIVSKGSIHSRPQRYMFEKNIESNVSCEIQDVVKTHLCQLLMYGTSIARATYGFHMTSFKTHIHI